MNQQDGFKVFKLNNSEWLQVYTEYRILRKFYKIANDNGLKVHGDVLMDKHYYDDTSPEFLFDEKEKIWLYPGLTELAALAQHYGVLTRMLDWSNNLFVALYFACIGAMKRFQEGKEDNLILWALNAKGLQVNEQQIHTLGRDTCPLKIVVPPYYSNPNLRAQQGVLTYWRISVNMKQDKSVDRTPLDVLIKDVQSFDKVGLYKFKISNQYSIELYKFLQRFGYSAASIYPGYRGVVQQMEEDDIYVKASKNKGIDILSTYYF